MTKAIDLDPKDAIAYFERAYAYGSNKEYDQAIADYAKAIELDPRMCRPITTAATPISPNGIIERAIADLTRAVEIDPKYALAYYHRSEVRFAKKELCQCPHRLPNSDRPRSGRTPTAKHC